jgi:hypothetical protein
MKYFVRNGYSIDPIFDNIFSKIPNWDKTNNLDDADFIYMPLRLKYETNYEIFSKAKYTNNFIDSSGKLCKLSDNCMNNKIKLYQILKGKEYIPQSFIFNKNNFYKFKNIIKSNDIFILKPESEFARKGMLIINSYESAKKHINKESRYGWVFQKYIKNPLLYKNKKFHIRVYTLVVNRNDNLTAFVHKIGYVYLANKEFNLSNLDFDIHMTGAKYCNVHSFQDFKDYFGIDVFNKIWKKIKYIVKDSVYNFNINNNFNRPNKDTAFHLFAYDILIDQNYKPYLLEINNGIIGFETLPLYKHMCKNKIDPKMHPKKDLIKLFHDITHLVINQNNYDFEKCLEIKYLNKKKIKKVNINVIIAIMLLIFAFFYFLIH